MADDRKKKGGEPVLEFFWDSLELAADKTYSTTLRIKLTGWWEGGRPREVGVSVFQRGQEPPDGNAVRIQNGFGTFPLTGLEPGHHYHVVCYIGDRTLVQKMIVVPELPKPPKPEVEALEKERTEFERSRMASEKKTLEAQENKPTRVEKKIATLKAKTEKVKAEKEFEKVQEKPDPEEQALKSNRTRLESAKVAHELRELEPKTKKPEEEVLESERLEFQAEQVWLERAKIAKELKKLEEKPRVACSDLMVRFSGPRGNQKFVISVSAEDGTLIPHHPIGLIDGDRLVGLKTNEDGFAFYETNFQESSRYFEIRVGNSHDLMWRARLLGSEL